MEKSVGTLVFRNQETEVLLKEGHDLLKSLLVSDLVIEKIFHIWQKRRTDTLGVVFCQNRFICSCLITLTYATVLLLHPVKEINKGISIKVLIAV